MSQRRGGEANGLYTENVGHFACKMSTICWCQPLKCDNSCRFYVNEPGGSFLRVLQYFITFYRQSNWVMESTRKKKVHNALWVKKITCWLNVFVKKKNSWTYYSVHYSPKKSMDFISWRIILELNIFCPEPLTTIKSKCAQIFIRGKHGRQTGVASIQLDLYLMWHCLLE